MQQYVPTDPGSITGGPITSGYQRAERYSPEDEAHRGILKADIKPQVYNREGMSEHDLTGIESERQYDKMVDVGGKVVSVTYKIVEPVRLFIKRRPGQVDSHRIVDAKGVTHYIDGWHAIRWKGIDGNDGVTF